METWLILSILTAVFFGANEFLSKIVAKNNLDKDKYIYWGIVFSLPITFVYFLYEGGAVEYGFIFLILMVIRQSAVIEKNLSKIKSLKYLDSSIFFPVQKTIRIIGGFFAGMFLFNEFLNTKEYIFIFLSIIIIFLFVDMKEIKLNKNFKKGIIFLLISSAMLIITSTINKYVGENFDIPFYVFISEVVGVAYFIIKDKIVKKKKVVMTKKENKQLMKLSLLNAFFGSIGFIFLLNSLNLGKLVIVQVITSFVIFIPIILSYFVYDEKINKRKFLALVLFVANVLFLLLW